MNDWISTHTHTQNTHTIHKILITSVLWWFAFDTHTFNVKEQKRWEKPQIIQLSGEERKLFFRSFSCMSAAGCKCVKIKRENMKICILIRSIQNQYNTHVCAFQVGRIYRYLDLWSSSSSFLPVFVWALTDLWWKTFSIYLVWRFWEIFLP